MGDYRETVGVLPQHSTPPAILAAIGCPDVVTSRFPISLAGVHPMGFPGDTHPILQSVARHHRDVANINAAAAIERL